MHDQLAVNQYNVVVARFVLAISGDRIADYLIGNRSFSRFRNILDALLLVVDFYNCSDNVSTLDSLLIPFFPSLLQAVVDKICCRIALCGNGQVSLGDRQCTGFLLRREVPVLTNRLSILKVRYIDGIVTDI